MNSHHWRKPRDPTRHPVYKIRNRTLRNLAILFINRKFKNPLCVDPVQIEDYIRNELHVSRRTAYDYRQALLEIMYSLGA